ncbi:MAG: hypothetical protein PHU14_15940, partial [Methylovulum sp.]|nr:hypothetical protein [Methylovulum sp.]
FMGNLYILDGQIAMRCPDVLQWAEFMAEPGHVQVDFANLDGAAVSTVFLGIDYNHCGIGDPLLFETLVFYGNGELGSMRRYFCWAEAVEGHEEVVGAVRAEIAHSVRITAEVLATIRTNLSSGKG